MEINQPQTLLLANGLFVSLTMLCTCWVDPVLPHLSWRESGFIHHHCLVCICKTSAFLLQQHHRWVQPVQNSPEHVVSVNERLKTHTCLQMQLSKGWRSGNGNVSTAVASAGKQLLSQQLQHPSSLTHSDINITEE